MSDAAFSRQTLSRLTVFKLGIAQLTNWGTTYFLPGAFGKVIAEDLGWSGQQVFAGLSAGLLVMGLVSLVTARLLQSLGARQMMQLGAGFNAAGCCVLALCETPQAWFFGWALLGVGMRLTLYDALFAALVGLLGPQSRPLMVQITLVAGLSSAVFWPMGNGLQGLIGWRSAVAVYGALALMSGLLLSGLPNAIARPVSSANAVSESGPTTPRPRQWGYALSMALLTFMGTGFSAHLPALLVGFGMPVAVGALLGVGQTGGRLLQGLLAGSMTALRLHIWVAVGMVLSFSLALCCHGVIGLVCVFIFVYGAMNGLATLLRANLPFVLFAEGQYARLQGRLLAPSFVLAAAAPWFFAWVQQSAGDRGLLWLSLGISCAVLMVAVLLDGYCRRTVMSCPDAAQ
ncbi:MFS transporter [Pseudomonas sp. CDFA 602]|uniref:MFS transporter n=1 Tax=Pseudomonas californiensis TaxID=2829823 RepID=UPI001E3B317E|nr:MFS transporter [Pseudomonas californiensis]MCD5995518.1 MFS transporter [Pseudomonas californiensis]MCD6001112.1 MFS transporter [Pseudomonas californiensis]